MHPEIDCYNKRHNIVSAGNMPPQLDNFLGKLKDILDTTKKLSDKQLKDAEERNKVLKIMINFMCCADNGRIFFVSFL